MRGVQLPAFLFLFLGLSLGFLAPAQAQSSRDFRDWIKSPDAHYATPEERTEWEKIGTEDAAARFIAEYWARRGGEAFRKEVQKRIEFADKKFSVGPLSGARSQKGRVWMLLGTPKIERTERASGTTGDIGSTGPNIFERQSKVRTTWIYKIENLPPALGIPELKVEFQTDVSRGFQVIENPAAVEPYLAKAAALTVKSPLAAAAGLAAQASIGMETRRALAPLWKGGEALAGARFFGSTYWNAKREPLYAFQIFLPSAEKRFADLQSALFVGIVQDAAGNEVASFRESADLTSAVGPFAGRSFEKSLVLPGGKYTGVFSLFSPDGQALLTGARAEFEIARVPEGFHVSPLQVTNNVITLPSPPQPFDAFVFGGGKYVPKGDRRFGAQEKVGYFVVIRNPAGEPEPSVNIRMTFWKDNQPFVRTPPAAAELVKIGEGAYLNANAFDIGTFPPGHYRFMALFRDLKAPRESGPWKNGVSVETEFDVLN